MRIKKYQKIICLGLALLSIMVLPCYASDDGALGYLDYPILAEYESLYMPIYDIKDQKFIGTYNIIENSIPCLLTNNINNNYTIVLSLLEYNYSNSYSMGIGIEDNVPIKIIYPVNKFEGKLLNTDQNVLFLVFNIPKNYFIKTNNLELNYTNYNYYVVLKLIYQERINGIWVPVTDTNQKLGQLSLFSSTYNAVVNITSYTQLMIQNFGKAFTFMTGPALAWVLLGISVSLISFGVYTAKRFL